MTVETAPLAIALLLAGLGGLLSFLSPCVLPLVPGYLGYLGGTVVQDGGLPSRRHLLLHASAFVLGFALVFTLAGFALGLFVERLQSGLDALRWIGGIAVIVIGLHMLGWLRLPFLDRQARIAAQDRLPRGRLTSSFLLGVIFAAGWSPCIGSILSGIFAIAATQSARAGLLFFVYALGLGIPFLLTALLFGSITPLLRRVNRHGRAISLVSGTFLILVGLLLVTDSFARLAALGPPIEPPFVGQR